MPDDDQLPTHPLRILARLVIGGILAIVLYVLSGGPICYLFGYRTQAMDAALFHLYAPLRWDLRHSRVAGCLTPYYLWWWRLPGGVRERSKAHPEFDQWNVEMTRREIERERSGE